MKKILLLLVLTLGNDLFCQTHTLSGLVLDAESLQPLPSATIRILGTSKGTVTNSSGQFRLSFQQGIVSIAASYLGYQSDTITVDLNENRFYGFKLYPNAIQLAGITITDEDPAYEIIRRAIESKKKWMKELQTFEGKAFNRLQIRTDSSIAAITEAFSTLYWNKDDSLREVITQQKQTGNIPKTFQSSRVGNILNFNDDKIRQNGYTFVGPTAPNAFEYYDYKLLSTRKMDDFEIYEIELIPVSKVTPLFKGKISIAERSYAVMDVDVRPNEALTQLFIDTKDSRYKQTFRLFENKFWLPANYRFDGTFKISVMGFSFPSFGIERDVVVYDYTINPIFADTILLLKKFTIDSSATTYDSAFWHQNDVLPLTEEQDSAYQSLDSTQTLDKKFVPKGAGAALLDVTESPLGFFDLWFNRVEGFHFGLSKSFSNVFENIDLRGGFGYGISDKQWKYEAGTTIHVGDERTSSTNAGFANVRVLRKTFSLSIDTFDKHIAFPDRYISGLLLNSFAALFYKRDDHDYYRAVGGSTEILYVMNGMTRFSLKAMSEKQLSLYQKTNYSIIFPKKAYAFQPSIINGRMNSITVSFFNSSSGIFAFAKDAYLISGSIEHSANMFGGVFDFTKAYAKARTKIATMNRDEVVFPPTLGFQIAGGMTLGHLPPQRYFELYSNFEAFSGYGMLRGLTRRSFYGDSYLALTVDHNFRRVLFEPLGIQWLMESNLELIVEANAARSWFSKNAILIPLFPTRDSNGWYFEASVGITNVLDVFRVDVTRTLSSPNDWFVSLTVSDFITGLIAQ